MKTQTHATDKVICYPDRMRVLQNGKMRDLLSTDRIGNVLHTDGQNQISYHELLLK